MMPTHLQPASAATSVLPPGGLAVPVAPGHRVVPLTEDLLAAILSIEQPLEPR